jgi:hypothetical protein
MAKKHISGTDLIWRVLEEFSQPGSRSPRMSIAVVPDDKHGWRVIVDNRGRRFLKAADQRRLAGIERRLRIVYALQR